VRDNALSTLPFVNYSKKEDKTLLLVGTKIMFQIIEFLNEYGVEYITEGTKHCTEGWVQIECPFCVGNPGYHLGFNMNGEYWNCWRCDWHSMEEVVMELTHSSRSEARIIIKQFNGRPSIPIQSKKIKVFKRRLEFPVGTRSLQKQHREYLKRRKFNDKELEKIWGLKGTGFTGPYKYRIIAPIFYQSRMVSYQGRDITDKQTTKYKACKKELELIQHKHLLYGLDFVKGKTIVVCEGVTDVWRMGKGAVATFGTSYTQQQMNLLSEFQKVYMLFDTGEIEASRHAEKAAYSLSSLGIETDIVELDKNDPADLDQQEAEKIMKLLIK
jgi:hypothetical protein